MSLLALKIDVDTLRGYKEGMPRMLSLLKDNGIRASIFFSFGPDNSGKAIRRIFRKGFISKMLRTKAPSTYGIKTLLYGTVLPAPMIVKAAPDIFVRAVKEGHDCGVHAWNHVLVQDELPKLTKEEFRALFEKAASMFCELSGKKPKSYAAPGWQTSKAALDTLSCLGLDYASDVRGYEPFIPVFEGKTYFPMQIPTTMSTMDEIYGLPGVNDETMPRIWLDEMDKEWNVLTVHAEMEGMSKLAVFEAFIKAAKKAGTTFMTLDEYAKNCKPKPCPVKTGQVKGRAGTLALQS